MFEYGNDGPSLILVGLDGSETSLRAGAYAAGLARRQRSRLVCIYVHAPNAFAGTVPSAIIANAAAGTAVAEELRGLIHSQKDRIGIEVELIERHGNPHGEIRRAAMELRADAVIVGASVHAGHRLIGSLAVQLVRDALWPVTVVP